MNGIRRETDRGDKRNENDIKIEKHKTEGLERDS